MNKFKMGDKVQRKSTLETGRIVSAFDLNENSRYTVKWSDRIEERVQESTIDYPTEKKAANWLKTVCEWCELQRINLEDFFVKIFCGETIERRMIKFLYVVIAVCIGLIVGLLVFY